MKPLGFPRSFEDDVLIKIEAVRPDLVPIAAQAMREEHERLERGDYTQAERENLELIAHLAQSAARRMDNIITARCWGA